MEPIITTFEGVTLCGLSKDFTQQENAAIPKLWDDFMDLAIEAGNEVAMPSYGVSYNVKKYGDKFSYLAGFSMKQCSRKPEKFIELLIPEGLYAKFTHIISPSGDFSADIRQSYNHILTEWLPNSDYHHGGTPEFELYDERFKGLTTNGSFDIFIPVVKK